MQEVERRSTEMSHEEAIKVEKALSERLPKHGLIPLFRLQGSVPLNTHIRGVSDVDLLEIHGRFFTYGRGGVLAASYGGTGPEANVVQEVLNMRSISEDELNTHFWAATVDSTNA